MIDDDYYCKRCERLITRCMCKYDDKIRAEERERIARWLEESAQYYPCACEESEHLVQCLPRKYLSDIRSGKASE